MDLPGLLDRLGTLTDSLAKHYTARGDTIAEKIKATNIAWSTLGDLGVTERRESARAAGAQFDALIARDDGEILALEVERDYIKVCIEVERAGLTP